MSVELIKTIVDVNEMTKKESSQIVKERDIIVPDGKPDMQRVLYLDGKVNIEQVDVQQDRVVYKGQVDATILYVADNNRDVYIMKGSIPLEDFMILEGVDPEQKVEFEYRVENMHWNILNERKLNVKAILEVTAAATRTKKVTMVTGIESSAPVQTRISDVNIIKQSETREEKIIVKDEITVPQGKGSIGEILEMYAAVKEDQIKRTDNEILFNGVVEVATMYKSQEDPSVIEITINRIPFMGNTDLVKSDHEEAWDCELEVKPTQVTINPDYDGEDRIIDIECIVTARYTTFDKVKEQVVEDIYCPGKKIDTTDIQEEYMTLANRFTTISKKKEMIQMPDTTPENNEIFSVQIKPIIDEKSVRDDKLTINGMLQVKATYTNKEGTNPIESSVTMIPFSQEASLDNVDRKAYVDAKVISKDVEVINQGKGEATIEYTLGYTANIYARGNLDVIQDVALVDMDKQEMSSYPSITVYVVKKGDSLWDVAKSYNTTVEDIIDINGIEDKNQLHQGQKIIILKKTKFD